MNAHSTTLGAIVALALSPCLCLQANAQTVGDTCSDPLFYSGDGLVAFDMTGMVVPDAVSWMDKTCFQSNPGHEIDAYICWTSNVDGIVDIQTCGLTNLDTQMALFEGCVCPDERSVALCCSDNDCGKQTQIRCNVVCDQQYMLLVSAVALLENNQLEVQFTAIDDPCDTPGGTADPITCEDCCGGIPEVTGFGGLQAIATQWRDSSAEFVAHVYDLDPGGLSPPGSNSSPPTYEHADWTLEKLGTVFGCAIGGDGTMYVAATSVFWLDAIGSLGGPGSIYRLDGTTGAPSELIALPNQFSSTGYPALGNIAFDCTRDVLFASNFDDGLIWAIDPNSGTPLDTYRHADDSVLGPAGDPQDPVEYAPLGDRVWAVQPVGDRLYYSVWVEEPGRPNPTRNNEVWSVGLDPGGFFSPGTRQYEFSSPDYADNKNDGTTSPIADLAQGPDCCLYAAERAMTGDTNSTAHRSRMLVACQAADGTWTVDPNAYIMGEIPNSAAGGVAVDFIDDGNLWGTADAALFGSSGEYAYGIQGTPRPGGDYSTSVQIDLDSDIIGTEDKGEIGSIEITCIQNATGPCMAITQYDTIECVIDATGPTGEYVLHLQVTNLSDNVVQYLLIPDGSTSPSMIPFNPPLNPGNSALVDLVVTGNPLQTICVPLVLFDVEGEECCTDEICVELPECDCAVIVDIEIDCDNDGSGNIILNFTLTNLTNEVIEHVYLLPQVGSGTIITPDHIDVVALAPYGSVAIGPITISTTVPAGEDELIFVSLHNETFKECCAVELPFIVPDCGSGSTVGDLNGDGVVDGADLAILLGAWGSSGPGDLNGDGVVDGTDLAILLGAWSP